VITTAANQAMAELHHRMPAILGKEGLQAWLDPAAAPEALQALLRPCPDDWKGRNQIPTPGGAHEVGSAVGNVRNEGQGLIDPVGCGSG